MNPVFDGPVWFVGCVENEGEFQTFGPFFSLDDALVEAKADTYDGLMKGIKCESRQLIGRQVSLKTHIGIPCFIDAALDNPYFEEWRKRFFDGELVAGVIKPAKV